MKEKIIAYLSGPRPYREGIALYEEYGLNLMLKATFRRNAETDLLRATLMEELRKLAGISETAFRTMQRKAVDSPHISSASIVVEEIKAEKIAVNVPVTPVVENVIRFRDRFPFLNSPDCPDVLKILVADMFTAYDLYLKTFRELEELIGVATSEKDGLMPSIQRMTTSYQKDQQKYCKIAEFRNRLTGISMLISVFKNHENSSPSVVLLTGYSGDLSVNSIKRGIYLTNVYYQKKENKTIVYVKSSAYVYISTLCIGMNGSLKLSHENNLDLPSDAIEIPIS